MYAAHSTQRVAGPTPSVAGPAQADCVQSQPQDTLQVPSASAALASALDSGKFTLTADFVAARRQGWQVFEKSSLNAKRN